MKNPFRRQAVAEPVRRARIERLEAVDIGGLNVGASGLSTSGGFGGPNDKAASAQWGFEPTNPFYIEALRRTSWSARRIVETVVEDMTAKWRSWDDEDGEAAKTMIDAEAEFDVRSKITDAACAGRWHGTSALLIKSMDAPFTSELLPENVRPGDLVSLEVVESVNLVGHEIEYDFMSPRLGLPKYFTVIAWGHKVDVHPSRLLCFWGIRPLSAGGVMMGHESWRGTSVLEPVLRAINAEDIGGISLGQLFAENCLLVLKSAGFADMAAESEEEARERMRSFTQGRSVMGAATVDEGDDVLRLSTTIQGGARALTALGRRAAAAAGIPETRFLGSSPLGFSTGDSDMDSYAERINADQVRLLNDPLMFLDAVLARNAGLMEPPEWRWNPLVERLELTKIEVARALADTAQLLASQNIATLDERRALLRTTDVFEAVLSEDTPPELAEKEKAAEAAAEAMQQMALDGNGPPGEDGEAENGDAEGDEKPEGEEPTDADDPGDEDG